MTVYFPNHIMTMHLFEHDDCVFRYDKISYFDGVIFEMTKYHKHDGALFHTVKIPYNGLQETYRKVRCLEIRDLF